MTDLIEILEDYCNANEIVFVYGRKASLNLLDDKHEADTMELGKVYLMVEPFRRLPIINEPSGRVGGYNFTGSMFLVVNSNLDMPVYNELKNDVERSKYHLNVKPLLTVYNAMNVFLSRCTDITIQSFEAIDVYDIFDQNKDGLLITYNIRSDEY